MGIPGNEHNNHECITYQRWPVIVPDGTIGPRNIFFLEFVWIVGDAPGGAACRIMKATRLRLKQFIAKGYVVNIFYLTSEPYTTLIVGGYGCG